MRTLVIAAVLMTAGALPAYAAVTEPVAAQAEAAAFERDRQAILGQVGNYRVRFDMRETVSFLPGYSPLEPKTSGGFENVRVLEDTGDRIVLQHTLVMTHEGQTVIVKHWRQDWTYEPETVLTYAGPDRWVLSPVSTEDRAGAWSQTVWQTDDSPRYGGVGRWSHDNGLVQWTSNDTARPLARRDAIRERPYDRYVGVNRHALMPGGWVHIQDNLKLAAAEGDDAGVTTVVHEDVVNTYRVSTDYDPAPGDAYWAETADYWAAVRAAWDEAIARHGGIGLEEEPQAGAITGPALMNLADQIRDGAVTTQAAIEQARTLIAGSTTTP
ncbi:DUF6607 family protein [Brevundimonas bacteroides]|uniref:DUF6607 family protein n=1 Tax=Brevundimonas bacteroides TaxID=74311 RepID=UPI000495C0BE|nr:DUF6607 family protein [Brevundimonas bacteroides]